MCSKLPSILYLMARNLPARDSRAHPSRIPQGAVVQADGGDADAMIKGISNLKAACCKLRIPRFPDDTQVELRSMY
jgi:hypothetical protein